MEKCEKISSEMADVISDLTNHTQADDGEHENGSYITKQPALLNSRSVMFCSNYHVQITVFGLGLFG